MIVYGICVIVVSLYLILYVDWDEWGAGNVMVEIPKFYHKYENAGCTVYPAPTVSDTLYLCTPPTFSYL